MARDDFVRRSSARKFLSETLDGGGFEEGVTFVETKVGQRLHAGQCTKLATL